jgi:hypothetical protein
MRKLSWTLLALVAVPLQAQDVERWDLGRPRVAVRFNAGLLRDIGVTLTPSGRPSRDGYLAHELGAEGRMTAVAPGSMFRTVGAGEVRLTSGPALVWKGGSVSLAGAIVRPGAEPASFTITAADGSPIFFADHQHHAVDRKAGLLRVFNLDVRLAPALADRLGESRHAGLTVGVLEMEMTAGIPRGSVERPLGGCTTPNWGAPNNDVGLIAMTQVQQMARGGGIVAVAPSAVLKNVGQTDVPWWGKFSSPQPPYGNDQHPFLVWNMYRVANGALQQIGASGLKHAFLTLNTNCGCPSGNILWVNCEDTYSASTNNDSGSLSPRGEVTSRTGVWQRCGSIFDTNCDGIQNSAPGFTGPADPRRLTALETDLQTAGATYYFESWYVVRDDDNIFNGMGWRQVAPSFGGTSWTFGLLTTLAGGPAIDAWVNPASPGPGADSQRIRVPDGQLTLAVRATDVGSGRWRYDYALMNHDFDRRIRSFSVPLPMNAVVTNTTFHDVDRDAATDWVASVVPGDSISWRVPQNPAARLRAPLDWGLLDSFSFEVNQAPSAVQGVMATLGIAEAPGGSLNVAILGPAVP